jgi:hypothetical protein
MIDHLCHLIIKLQHYWSGTGKVGNELDLAGLVCNSFGDETCINPCKGLDGGVTWKDRMTTLGKLEDESQNDQDQS